MLHVALHGNCPDGTGAGWVVREALEAGDGPDSRRYFGDYQLHWLNYDSPLPSPDSADDRLWMIDYSRLPSVIHDEAGWEYRHVMLLDHHASAVGDWQGDPGWMTQAWRDLDPRSTLDVTRSGAGIAWDVLMPGRARPALVNYVEDRDLWKFALPESRTVNQWIRTFPLNEPEAWGELAAQLEDDLASVVILGAAIERANAQHVKVMADRAVFMAIQGHRVPVCNATVLFSEVGEELCRRYPEAPFAAYYFDRPDGIRQWGARSRGGFDLVPLARKLGGGGHPAAAGWTGAAGPIGSGGWG